MIFSGIPVWVAVSVAGGASAILLALHFLHRKYSHLPVPTLMFWQSDAERHRRNRLGGRLGRLLTFLLLVSILLLMGFAALRPTVLWGGRTPTRYVVILDCRASMGIVDAGQPHRRLDRALDLCRRQLASVTDADETVLITVAETAEVAAGMGDAKSVWADALRAVSVSDSLSNAGMRQALAMAETMAFQRDQTRVLLFTDHGHVTHHVSEQLKPRLLLFDLSGPVVNAALLGVEANSAGQGRLQLVFEVGCWGQGDLPATLELHDGETVLQKQELNLSPGTITHYSFEAENALVSRLSARLICEDRLTQDNVLSVAGGLGGSVYAADDIPVPLRLCLEANDGYRRSESPADAAMIIARYDSQTSLTASGVYLVSEGRPIEAVSRIIPTEHLFSDEDKRYLLGIELYIAGGNALAGLPEEAVPLLATEDGHLLAAAEQRDSVTVVWLAEALFQSQSTFWKQPQFPELCYGLLEHVADGRNASMQSFKKMQVSPDYANLWSAGTVEPAGVSAEMAGRPVSLYRGILIAAMLLLIAEIIGYYRGVIV